VRGREATSLISESSTSVLHDGLISHTSSVERICSPLRHAIVDRWRALSHMGIDVLATRKAESSMAFVVQNRRSSPVVHGHLAGYVAVLFEHAGRCTARFVSLRRVSPVQRRHWVCSMSTRTCASADPPWFSGEHSSLMLARHLRDPGASDRALTTTT